MPTREIWNAARRLYIRADATRGIWVVFLLILSAGYSSVYLGHPALPGNQSYPLGWWGWFDQGEYIKSARAFAAGNLTPDSHTYPPLYPLLASFFIKVAPDHPFFLVNLVALLVVAGSFLVVAARYVGQLAALAIFVLTVVADYMIFQQYLMPWTSTPVAAIFSLLVLLLDGVLAESFGRRMRAAAPFLFGLVGGALVPLRPIDAVVFAPLFLALLWHAWRGADGRSDWRRLFLTAFLLGLGLLPGICLFFGFNLRVFHSAFGSYLSANSSNGFTVERLPDKLVSLLFDSKGLYLEPGAEILRHYPWILLSILGLVQILLRGPALFRAIAGCMLVSVAFYFSYNDLLPNGIWRYFNIHYFKWMMPWLGLFALWPVLETLRGRLRLRSLTAMLVIVFGVSCIHFTAHAVEGSVARIESPNSFEVDSPPASGASSIDMIDLAGVEGDFVGLYLGQHHVSIDGRDYRTVTDFRVLPSVNGARLLFIRPMPSGKIRVTLDPRDTISPERTTVVARHYSLTVGRPCWLFHCH